MNIDKMLNMYLLDRSKKQKYSIINITTYNEGRKSNIFKLKIGGKTKKAEEFRNKRDLFLYLVKKDKQHD